MDPLALLASLCVLVTVALLVIGLGRGKASSGQDLAERLQAFRQPPRSGGPEGEEREGLLLKKRSYSGLPGLSSFLAQFRSSEKVALELERAGLPLRVGEYYLMRWGAAFLFFLAPFLFNRGFIGLIFAIGLGILGYFFPAAYVSSKRKARTAKFNAQLVELLGLISNSLKSGYGLMQSFEFASQQLRPPISLEIKRMLREAALGKSAEEAILGLGERIESADLDMVLTAINIQRAVGGNLAEILDNVSFTMRERERIRGELRTLTAQGRMTGIIIGGLPVGIGLLFFLINPDYMGLLFTHTVGRIILLAAIGLEIVGAVSVKRIMAVEV